MEAALLFMYGDGQNDSEGGNESGSIEYFQIKLFHQPFAICCICCISLTSWTFVSCQPDNEPTSWYLNNLGHSFTAKNLASQHD